ncbi:hypothetical protein NWO25_15515 [Enterococcus lactis]|nr:hypothetical protein [Enterococcus lactis]
MRKTKESIRKLAKDITASFSDGFNNLKDSFKLNKGQTEKLRDSVNNSIEDIITEKSLTLSNQVKEIKEEYEKKKQEAEKRKDETELKVVTQQYEEENKR